MTDTKLNSLEVKVECYAGYRGEETPRRFFVGKRSIRVRTVVDRWLAPDHRYFKVRGEDDGLYILRHDSLAERWEMVMFQAVSSIPADEDHQEPGSLH